MNTNNQCPVCLENMSSYVNLKCEHKMCIRCFLSNTIYLNTKCPLCRDTIVEVEPLLIKFNDDVRLLNDYQLEIYDLKIRNKRLIKNIKKTNKTNNILNKIGINLGNSVVSLLNNQENNINLEEEYEEEDYNEEIENTSTFEEVIE